MAKTKEEIVREIVQDGFQNDYDKIGNLVPVFKEHEVVENILAAMDAYAQQESIEFAEWAAKYYGMGDSYWISLDDFLGEEPISTSQLYQQYLSSKTK